MPQRETLCRHAFSRGREFSLPGAESHYPPDLELEPRHLDINLRIDVPTRAAEGRVVTTVTANRAGARRLVLQAVGFEDMEVLDTEGRAVSWRYDGRELRVRWQDAFAAEEERSFSVAYRLHEPINGMIFGVPDDKYPDRAPWVASDHETERARYWLPSVDHPAVRTTLARSSWLFNKAAEIKSLSCPSI